MNKSELSENTVTIHWLGISIYAFEHSLQCKCFGDFTFFSSQMNLRKIKGGGEA